MQSTLKLAGSSLPIETGFPVFINPLLESFLEDKISTELPVSKTMAITPDSIIQKLLLATKDSFTYKMVGDKIQVFFEGNLVREIPLGSGQAISSQSTTYR